MKINTCKICDCGLVKNKNWYNSHIKRNVYICKKCSNIRGKIWAKENPDKYNRIKRKYMYKNGIKPMSENKECSKYLGCHIAERVLSKVFKDVEVMPPNHPGYDFICNRGKKIDVKSSCTQHQHNRSDRWIFIINENKYAEYFLCIAFDNRKKLNPLYMWLIPSKLIHNQKSVSISKNTLYKWDSFKLNIDDVIEYCDKIITNGMSYYHHLYNGS